MAKHARVSQWHIAQVWKAADLRPLRLKPAIRFMA